MARTLAWAGARPGDIVHNAYGYGLFTGGLGFHYGAERLGCTVVPVSGGNTERQVTLMTDFGAHVLCATPSYALNIAEVAKGMGVDVAALPLRLGTFGAEPWSEPMRHDFEVRSASRRSTSTASPKSSAPASPPNATSPRNGLHGWEDHFLFEVIDPDTLAPRPLGEIGQLVITTLTKEALPIIRYRTRDITRLSDEPCACGRTHLRIMRVTGRNDDMLIIRGVNVFPSQVEAALIGLPGLAPHYQIVLSREGTLDAMTVEVERAAAKVARRAASLEIDARRHLQGRRQAAGRGATVPGQGGAGAGRAPQNLTSQNLKPPKPDTRSLTLKSETVKSVIRARECVPLWSTRRDFSLGERVRGWTKITDGSRIVLRDPMAV